MHIVFEGVQLRPNGCLLSPWFDMLEFQGMLTYNGPCAYCLKHTRIFTQEQNEFTDNMLLPVWVPIFLQVHNDLFLLTRKK